MSLAEPARQRQRKGRAACTAGLIEGVADLAPAWAESIGQVLLASGIAGWLWQTYDAATTFHAGALLSVAALALLLGRGARRP